MNATAIIVGSVFCSAMAHLSLRVGMAGAAAEGGVPVAVLAAGIRSPYTWGGIALYGIALLSWMIALSRVEISYAYPFLALGFAMVAALSWLLLGEHLSWIRIAGTAIIVAGVVLVAQS